uniref:HAT C-terminal dimerisation domain-containing protein n=1 Tax=Diacronema lutheri TaxID=2081491 RepID=A0A7R9YPF6_DIALT
MASGFKYLEDRLTGKCSAPLNCAPELEFFDLVRAFNPTFACEKRINAEWVRKLFQISPLACADDLLEPMCAELPRYLAEAKDVRIDRKSVDDFTKAVLEFWRFRVRILPSWARAARIVFALSCNSASCERVFSLMESMFPFTSQQTCVLSDDIGGAVMLKYNKRGLG